MHIRPHNRNLNERLPSRAPRGRGSTKVPILKDLQSTLDQIKKSFIRHRCNYNAVGQVTAFHRKLAH